MEVRSLMKSPAGWTCSQHKMIIGPNSLIALTDLSSTSWFPLALILGQHEHFRIGPPEPPGSESANGLKHMPNVLYDQDLCRSHSSSTHSRAS